MVLKARGNRALAHDTCRCKMTSVMALDGVTSFLHLKDVKIKRKHMRNSPTLGGISLIVSVIIHGLSVSCTKINHSFCALVILSS